MSLYFGIDTSNYTTSVAIYDNVSNSVIQKKLLLPVKENELGLRQSDAVFYHTKQLPVLVSEIFDKKEEIKAIGVSNKPRNIDGSYMPCFLSGEGLAESLSAFNSVPLYKTSHQVGHILAALYSSGNLGLINQKFIAFHVSGGTTDCLLIEPDKEQIIKATEISTSLDLKAGQLIDRVGVMLGLRFPCGAELDKLSVFSNKTYKIKPTLKSLDCCLSGVENKCRKMMSDGETKEDIAKFCIQNICSTIEEMTIRATQKFGEFPLIYSGGVMSNSFINNEITNKFNAFFAKPEFSCDNAVGTAIFASLKEI